MRVSSLLLAIGLCLPAFAETNPKDQKGCVDSKVLSRLSGCFIYSCKVSKYDAVKLPVLSAKTRETKIVEGAAEDIQYFCAQDTSMIEIVRNAERAMKQAGFTIRFQADGSNWAGVTGQKGPQWVNVESRRGSYTMKTVLAKELEVTMKANAEGWAQQIEQNGRASIYGINFDTGKASIRPDSEQVLGEVLKLLQTNATWRIAVAGHTDNVGAKEMNLTLSRQRAQSVVAWLTGRGIPADRLLPGGFGDLAPMADNSTDDGRSKNRRVDLIKLY